MLRSGELLPTHRDELNAENGTVDIPARRVNQSAALRSRVGDHYRGDGQLRIAFAGRFGDAPPSRQAMSGALTGTKVTKNGKRVTRMPGICELLGLRPFTLQKDLQRVSIFNLV
jgi:hypothetical protein